MRQEETKIRLFPVRVGECLATFCPLLLRSLQNISLVGEGDAFCEP